MNADFMKGKIKIEKIIGRIKKRNLRKFYNNYNSEKGKLCVEYLEKDTCTGNLYGFLRYSNRRYVGIA
jgi:hypothetical protein